MTDQPAPAPVPAPDPTSGRTVSRPVRPWFPFWGWLGVWIAAGLVVLTTLVAFLLGIVGDLESIDGSLAEASKAVGGAGGHVKPLPSYIADVNTTLTAIDGALKPVPGATHDISGSLVGMRGNLEKVDGSLKTTSGSLTTTAGALGATSGSLSDTAKALIGTSSSLVDTASVLKGLSGSLADTSNVLNTVRTVGGQILDVLKHTQSNPDQLGTENLWMRADQTLTIRAAAEHDTASIVGGITDVNKHLKSVCNRIPLPPSC
jgi:ABC-type transporter Mla subunit MlaD